jgi:predicted secreted acid phosphatase
MSGYTGKYSNQKASGKRQGSQSKPVPRRKTKHMQRIITVDLDGTVADISQRREFALKHGEERSPQFYEVLLDPQHFYLDEPVGSSRDFLTAYVTSTQGEIVYLSGRRVGTEANSREWLISHGFPDGRVIHRRTGRKSADFKFECLSQLSEEFRIDGHFGDREIDDGQVAEKAGVRYFLIKDYQWPIFSEIQGFFVRDVSSTVDYGDIS